MPKISTNCVLDRRVVHAGNVSGVRSCSRRPLQSVHRHWRSFGLLAVVVSALLLGFSGRVANAQLTSGVVLGTVTDATGAVIPGAMATLTNLGTGVVGKAESNETGNYVFNLLIPGQYSVSIEANGFKKVEFSTFSLVAGERFREDAKLELGQVAETVKVTSAPPLLQTDSSTVSSSVTEQQVQDLPLNGRNFVNLVQLQPGVTAGPPTAISSGQRPDDRRATSTISANGQSDSYNNEMLDGLDNNELEQGFIGVRPSIDAIAEVVVDTNNANAEIGRSAGAVVNIITKSGTNAYHGSVYEYFRNDVFDAREFFTKVGVTPKPEYRQNQFGSSIGGPIKKGKTFFFGDVEENRVVEGLSSGTLTVPTLYEQDHPGDFSDVKGPTVPAQALNPVGLAYFKLYPKPNVNGASPINNYTNVVKEIQNTLTFDGRIDHHFANGDSFFGRYSYNNVKGNIPGFLPSAAVGSLQVQPNGVDFGFAGQSTTKAHGVQFNYVHILTPNLVLELKTGYTRIDIASKSVNDGVNVDDAIGVVNGNVPNAPQTTGLTPLAFLSGGYAGLGDSPFLPILDVNNTFQYMGSLTYTHGRHNIKIGTQLIRRQLNYFQNAFGLGYYLFAGLTGNSLEDLLTGTAVGYLRINFLTTPSTRGWESGTYVQDDWRVNSTLTLNLGLRYDIYTAYTEAHGRGANFYYPTLSLITSDQSPHLGVNTNYRNFGPRVGFSKSLGGKTVVRGGYGISYYPTRINGQLMPLSPQYVFNTTCIPCLTFPALPVPSPSSTTDLSGGFTYIPRNDNTSQVQQFNLFMQQKVGANVFTLGGIGELGRDQTFQSTINNPDPTGPYLNDTTQGPGPTPTLLTASVMPNLGQVTAYQSVASSNYYAMQAEFARRVTKGLGFNINYTWAHGLTDNSLSGSGSTSSVGLLARNVRYDYGNSQVDIRHRIAATVAYELPFAKASNGVTGVLLKGWQANAIVFWQTGTPFTVLDSFTNRNGVAQINLPSISTDRPSVTGQNYRAHNPSISNWLNLGAWTPQSAGTPGNEANEQYAGPHTRRADLSVFKTYTLPDKLLLQFRAECFNISNTPNFSTPNSTISGWAPGAEHNLGNPISTVGLLPGDIPTNAGGFGTISSTVPNLNPRQFQFALKLLF